MKQAVKTCGIAIVLLLCTVAIIGLSGYGITQINIAGGIVYVFCWVNFVFFEKHKVSKFYKATFLVSLLLTLSLTVGNIIRGMDASGLGRSVGLVDLIYGIGMFIFLFQLVHNLYYLLQSLWITDEKKYAVSWKTWIILAGIMLITWLPYTMTFFPGIIGSDPVESMGQALGVSGWTNHHPILYTAYIKLFLDVFRGVLGMNGALGCMIVAQQMIFAGVLSYFLCFMMKRGISQTLLLGSVLFVTLNPVVAIFSVYATKDVLYTACVLLFMLQIFQYIEYRKSLEEGTISEKISTYGLKQWVIFAITALLVIFLRNNGSFLVIASFFVLLVCYRKHDWKAFAALLVVAFLSLLLQKQVLFPLLQVEEGSFAESLSIPLQQVAQVVVDDGNMNEEEKAFIEKLLPLETIKEVYQAGYTDTIKFDSNFDDAYLNDNKMTFMKVWFTLLPKNFASYVKAYLLQTAGYWDITQTDSLTIYGVVDNEFGVAQMDAVEGLLGHSLQPLIEKLILVCRKAPVICYLTNMAMMLFFMIFVCTKLYLQKNKQYIIAFLPLIMTWLTIMIAAPASCKFRYLLPFYLSWPWMTWMLMKFGMQNKSEKK